MTNLWNGEFFSPRGTRGPLRVSKRRVLRTYLSLRRLAILGAGGLRHKSFLGLVFWAHNEVFIGEEESPRSHKSRNATYRELRLYPDDKLFSKADSLLAKQYHGINRQRALRRNPRS
jgi:hypothetical protein